MKSKTPTFPATDTLTGRALMRLLTGKRMTHLDFQIATASYRLAGFIHALRNRYHWPIKSRKEIIRTRDKTGRAAAYSRYFIEPETLKLLHFEYRGRIKHFIKAVKKFEQGDRK
jgi:hypothetical protein